MLTFLLRRSAGDKLQKHFQVHVGKRFEVDTTLPGFVRAKPREKPVRVGRRVQAINTDLAFPGRESYKAGVSFSTAFVFVVVAAESDNARPPHFRRVTGRLCHELCERLAVLSPDVVLNGAEVSLDACLCYFRFVFSHKSYSVG